MLYGSGSVHTEVQTVIKTLFYITQIINCQVDLINHIPGIGEIEKVSSGPYPFLTSAERDSSVYVERSLKMYHMLRRVELILPGCLLIQYTAASYSVTLQ